ncbi:UDP-Glc:alpha-D-GlcNAc-diphosphoundecaprenol beta-1,3-glucosyltransferase WfgD [Saliniradius amylolyticus]|uniref:UDP-Glc:alpha-D-GlcNAc-diphosphoundecaprenol beta-1,3-glucosyltransferase WfgD n=1 Tax=Saliniradius amylolyticus TaxID=2183582 RepID=A0A2S2E1Z1_9ALTE|nr:glycosyltransferase family A protein [Saliniradius amylolyticus]AWL11654.1 UDP-Glc:alpha-D-GlcNAc-diphosphoundecaprenol beta-1,3-glucosyltransferase WfgD [Saliniradius amylolyticus]
MVEKSKDTKSIAVLIPFFRAEAYFAECLASVLAQSLPPDEVLVADDNSTPQSRDFLSQFEPQIKVIPLSYQHGPGRARNKLIQEARSHWVAFQDSDDLWHPNKLERQLGFLLEHPGYAGCHTGVQTFNQQGPLNTYNNKPELLTVTDLMHSSQIPPPSFLVKRECLLAIGLFDTRFKTSEDYDLSIRLVSAGYPIGFIPEVLTYVRRANHGNISSQGFTVLRHHLKLMYKHHTLFSQQGVPHWRRQFIGQSMRQAGGKVGGLAGKALSGMGRLLTYQNE